MIKLKNVSKYYYSKGLIASGFSKINIEFDLGEYVAITGESGSGKSTLLNVISGLDSYEEGEMYIDGEETSHYLEKDWEIYRRKNIGNIYQNFNLINSYTVYQNIELALSLNGMKKKERKKIVLDLLKKVDMQKYKNTKVSKLSGGQKQRVAIARALAKDVPIIIADEPTGNLDKASATKVFEILKEVSKDKLVIVVTHNYDQVEPYVTRKITMHDGKILEDKKIKEKQKVEETHEREFKDLRIIDRLLLGFRNAFNVIPKFILLFLVYSFIVVALMAELSAFRQAEYEMGKTGYNYVFQDTNDHRIIMNKKDRTVFSKEEIDAIKNLKNVDYIIENDILVDQIVSWTTEDEAAWLSGIVVSKNNLRKKPSIGRLPEKENEIIIEGSEEEYFLNYEKDKILNKVMYPTDNMGEIKKDKQFIVTGIIYSDDLNNINGNGIRFYVSEEYLKDKQFETHEENSTITVDFMGTNHVSYPYTKDFHISVNNRVTPGYAIITEDYNMYCEKEKCIGKSFIVRTKNPYFREEKSFIVEKTYNKKTITNILDIPNYNKENYDINYNGIIYINPTDYKQLFDKGTYQMSVYVKDIEKLDNTVKKLEDMGYHTLKEKDTLAQFNMTEFVKIEKVIVTIILIVVLFFISYFIIKLILKSRNIYYAILRMLGASKTICRNLLTIELLTICNLSYFIFVGLVEINRLKSLNIGFINLVNNYFKLDDYVKLYGILIMMSILISMRYSRKLFKNSAMSVYREEV